jgi:hypothetical protein
MLQVRSDWPLQQLRASTPPSRILKADVRSIACPNGGGTPRDGGYGGGGAAANAECFKCHEVGHFASCEFWEYRVISSLIIDSVSERVRVWVRQQAGPHSVDTEARPWRQQRQRRRAQSISRRETRGEEGIEVAVRGGRRVTRTMEADVGCMDCSKLLYMCGPHECAMRDPDHW